MPLLLLVLGIAAIIGAGAMALHVDEKERSRRRFYADQATCDGVWHVTTPREPACPKCGATGPAVPSANPRSPS